VSQDACSVYIGLSRALCLGQAIGMSKRDLRKFWKIYAQFLVRPTAITRTWACLCLCSDTTIPFSQLLG
jgi:hypothetical protein